MMRPVTAVFSLFLLFPVLIAGAWAGTLDPPAGPDDPASAMHTVDGVYKRLEDGSAGARRGAGFAEPLAAPGGTGHTLDEVMAIAPCVDDANGAAAADVLCGKTFWGLTSGGWGTRTGSAPSAPVEKTGQTLSYQAHDDGDLQPGVSPPDPRWTDNGDGTVTDNLTRLVWCKKVSSAGGSWSAVVNYASNVADGDMWLSLSDGSAAGDWRAPTIKELLSVISYSQINYAIAGSGTPDFYFTVISIPQIWTSTTFADGSGSKAYYVDIATGVADVTYKSSSCNAWLVRDPVGP